MAKSTSLQVILLCVALIMFKATSLPLSQTEGADRNSAGPESVPLTSDGGAQPPNGALGSEFNGMNGNNPDSERNVLGSNVGPQPPSDVFDPQSKVPDGSIGAPGPGQESKLSEFHTETFGADRGKVASQPGDQSGNAKDTPTGKGETDPSKHTVSTGELEKDHDKQEENVGSVVGAENAGGLSRENNLRGAESDVNVVKSGEGKMPGTAFNEHDKSEGPPSQTGYGDDGDPLYLSSASGSAFNAPPYKENYQEPKASTDVSASSKTDDAPPPVEPGSPRTGGDESFSDTTGHQLNDANKNGPDSGTMPSDNEEGLGLETHVTGPQSNMADDSAKRPSPGFVNDIRGTEPKSLAETFDTLKEDSKLENQDAKDKISWTGTAAGNSKVQDKDFMPGTEKQPEAKDTTVNTQTDDSAKVPAETGDKDFAVGTETGDGANTPVETEGKEDAAVTQTGDGANTPVETEGKEDTAVTQTGDGANTLVETEGKEDTAVTQTGDGANTPVETEGKEDTAVMQTGDGANTPVETEGKEDALGTQTGDNIEFPAKTPPSDGNQDTDQLNIGSDVGKPDDNKDVSLDAGDVADVNSVHSAENVSKGMSVESPGGDDALPGADSQGQDKAVGALNVPNDVEHGEPPSGLSGTSVPTFSPLDAGTGQGAQPGTSVENGKEETDISLDQTDLHSEHDSGYDDDDQLGAGLKSELEGNPPTSDVDAGPEGEKQFWDKNDGASFPTDADNGANVNAQLEQPGGNHGVDPLNTGGNSGKPDQAQDTSGGANNANDLFKSEEPKPRDEDYDFAEEESPSSGHFFGFFLTAVVICISGYVIYHNKQKIMAFCIEGRNGPSRRRSQGVKYTQLKSNVEEVIPSLEKTATAKNFVY